jgi:GH24 family phage-related lysozyme (muramidase)
MKNWSYFWVVALLFCVVGMVNAQTKPSVSKNEPAASSANLIEATRDYKNNSEGLMKLQEEEIKKATQKLEQVRQLVADGLVARNELTAAEESVAALQATLEATQKKIGDAEHMITEIQSEEIRKRQEVAQAGLVNKSRSFVKSTVLRYNGAANWSLAYLGGIQNFFSSTFGRSLPTSTIGQSATHNRLGWDHRNSVDVGLHPDSVEGRTLISFLQTQGIPFLAFRGAIPGVSTGAHIHIGRPSHRLS